MVKSKVLIIGAAGAVGKRLTQALARAGSHVIASDRHDHLPSSIKNSAKVCVGGIDVRDEASVVKLFKDHADKDTEDSGNSKTRRRGTTLVPRTSG